MDRHESIDSIFLCQGYSKLPKQLLRDNLGVNILFQRDDVNSRHVLEEHVLLDMTYEEINKLYLK